MEEIEKLVLSAIYLMGVSGKPLENHLKTKNIHTKKIIDSKIDELVKNKLVNEDRNTLTELGRSSIRVVLAGGVFDIIHPGHIYTLNAAKAL